MDFTLQTRKQRQTKGHAVGDENKKRGNPIGFSYYSPIDSRCIPSGTHSLAGGHPIGQRNWHWALGMVIHGIHGIHDIITSNMTNHLSILIIIIPHFNIIHRRHPFRYSRYPKRAQDWKGKKKKKKRNCQIRAQKRRTNTNHTTSNNSLNNNRMLLASTG